MKMADKGRWRVIDRPTQGIERRVVVVVVVVEGQEESTVGKRTVPPEQGQSGQLTMSWSAVYYVSGQQAQL